MKTLTSALVSIIVAAANTTPAFATSTERQGLGTAANVVDVWTFTCPSKTESAVASVEDLNPPDNVAARLRVMLIRKGGAALAEDLNLTSTSGEGGGASPKAVLAKGAGLYDMLFYKAAVGKSSAKDREAYLGRFQCLLKSGELVNPFNVRKTQNQ